MRNIPDFGSLAVTRSQLSLLRRAASAGEAGAAVSDTNPDLDYLIDANLVAWCGGYVYAITTSGVQYLQYLSARRKARRVDWIRYWITTGIAIVALILSIIALLLETGVISLPRL